MQPEHRLVDEVGRALAAFHFEPRAHPEDLFGVTWSALWVRKTWNTNRAAILLRLPDDGRHAGELAQRLKLEVGRVVGFVPFFYGVGLQVIWSGYGIEGRADGLEQFVDRVDNQRSIVQSIHAVDLATRTSRSARTWGQVVTGKFQDAIESGIGAALR